MLPQVPAEPAAGHHPEGPGKNIDFFVSRTHRGRLSPQVNVVMRHPAAAVVVDACGLRTGLTDLLHELGERIGAFRKIAYLRRPVIHLQVEIDGIIGTPGCPQCIVPDALQVRRLGSGTGGANGKVSSELKCCGNQLRIALSRRKALLPLLHRKIFQAGMPEIQHTRSNRAVKSFSWRSRSASNPTCAALRSVS